MAKFLLAAFVATTLIACGTNPTNAVADSNVIDGSVQLKKIGDLKPSFYWVGLETRDGQPRDQPLKDMDGNVLVRVSKKFFDTVKLEGTGKLLDGRVINYKGRVGKEIRYRWCGPDAPYGYGLDDHKLVPFRSVAVDPTVVPIGSKVYIPQAKGAKLPDGKIHDGYFTAIDIGDAIKNHRIDVFTAYGDQSRVFKPVGLVHGKPVAVYLVK